MKTLARLSFPSSQRLNDCIESLPKRRRVVIVRDSDSEKEDSFSFADVYAISVTFHHACSEDMISAYDQLVQVDSSDWLREIQKRVSSRNSEAKTLSHYRIYLDDGPCYEFICGSYEYSNKNGA
jgi:hypothetical protein